MNASSGSLKQLVTEESEELPVRAPKLASLGFWVVLFLELDGVVLFIDPLKLVEIVLFVIWLPPFPFRLTPFPFPPLFLAVVVVVFNGE